MGFATRLQLGVGSFALVLATGTGCLVNNHAPSAPSTPPPASTGTLEVSGCVAGSSAGAWVPNLGNASASNHNSNVSVTNTQLTATAPMINPTDPLAQKEVSVTFTVPSDLGLNGSVTLLGEVSNYPTGFSGAYAILTSLTDGSDNEYINLPRDAHGNISCQGGALFTSCDPTNGCVINPACAQVGYPSAYDDFDHYWQHQIPNGGYESVNRFPTCRFSQGSSTAPYNHPSTPACAFNTYLSGTSGHLPVGQYTAKYLVMGDGSATVPPGTNATLTVTVTQRKDTVDTTVGGAIDLNVILVGSKNIADSHTASGQRNLDTMFTAYGNYLLGAYNGSNNANIKLGTVNVYELTCKQGGDALASINSQQVGTLLQVGSSAVAASSEGKAVNIFLLSEFSNSSAILGVDGQITAPQVNGLQTSGLTVATFNMLQTFNPACTQAPCPLNQQDPDFYEMGNTLAHETGHFLGLNHPSEASGSSHDLLYDTPICTTTDNPSDSGSTISIGSCLNADTNVFPMTNTTCNAACGSATASQGGYNADKGVFCPDVQECGFNHMMWWSSKNFDPATGAADGNEFSPASGVIMNFSSYVR